MASMRQPDPVPEIPAPYRELREFRESRQPKAGSFGNFGGMRDPAEPCSGNRRQPFARPSAIQKRHCDRPVHTPNRGGVGVILR